MRPRSKFLKFISIGLVTLVVVLAAGVGMLSISPSTGAYGADLLRNIFGNEAVALMETVLFRTQDSLKQIGYDTGLVKAENPFGTTTLPDSVKRSTSVGLPTSSVEMQTLTPSNQASTNSNDSLSVHPTNSAPGNTVQSTSEPAAWMPAAVDHLGNQMDDGIWRSYIQDKSGRVVAYRTYVQTDPTRPYASVGIVAFDMKYVRLNYQVGFDDPYAPGVKKSSKGIIPPADIQSEMLLAAFNGGFKYEHGHYGSMANDLVSVPPENGLGTVIIYKDGNVQVVEWGKDIKTTDNLVALRQNGSLMVQNGEISPKVDNSLVWGATITSNTTTMRSGIAISKDGRTLYYFSGMSLIVNTLAKAMVAAHAWAGIKLDINNFWVHFVAMHYQNGNVYSAPLLAKGMEGDKERFLRPYPRDFFYITSIP